jgi:diguanylate cyclase (GGDEF)-like protein
MLGLIVIFFVGYMSYTWLYWSQQQQMPDLIVPVIFFLGACFVWLTATLSLQTATIVLRISQLEQENILDPLTGAFNRRYLDKHLREEVSRARRYSFPLSVLLLDIDHFKQINDQYGHQVGDQVLMFFAKTIQQELREVDILARYGGEEFLVVASQTTRNGAIDLAERLRRSLESNHCKLPTKAGAANIQVRCSIGVATLGGAIDRLEKLVQRADENLYRAKKLGRNQVNADESAAGQGGKSE